MYYRFLNNNDYLGIMSQQSFDQTVRDQDEERLCAEAEMRAETYIRDYLTEHYMIDDELNAGKFIAGYIKEVNITYPAGKHIYINGEIYQIMQAINGVKKPINKDYWRVVSSDVPDFITDRAEEYSQMLTYRVGDYVKVDDIIYECFYPNGFELYNIRMPHFEGWMSVPAERWVFSDDYQLSDVVIEMDDDFKNEYYMLVKDDKNKTIVPSKNDNWIKLEKYDESSIYAIGDCAVYTRPDGSLSVVRAITNVNRDEVVIGKNVILNDPRNETLKNILLKLSVYELAKQISPNHLSPIRIKDYDDTMIWLSRAGSLKITPAIKRKKDRMSADTVGWATAQIIDEHNGGIMKTGWSKF